MPGYVNSLYSRTLTFTDDTGTAVDVSSYDFGIEVFQQGCGSAFTTLEEDAGIVDTSAASGIISFSLTAAQMTELGAGMMRVVLYRNYGTAASQAVVATGTEPIIGLTYAATGGEPTLNLRPAIDNLRIAVT